MELETSFESVRSFTQEEFTQWCEANLDAFNRFELLNGRIVMNPCGGWPQGEVGLSLGALLTVHVRRNSLGRTFGPDQGFELPSGDTVAPDLSWVSSERWVATEPHLPGKFLRLAPDLTVEVLSPSTASRDRGEKKAIYERNGVREYWLVDTAARRVTRFVLEGQTFGAPCVFEEGARFSSVVLADFAFGLPEIFS